MVSGTGDNEGTLSQTEFGSVDFTDENSPGTEPVSTATLVEKPDKLSDPGEAKKGPPKLDEWQDFFGRVVIRALVNGYLAFQLGDLFDELSPMEIQQITLSKEDMREMAAPFATVANNSSFARKHGRSIIALADSYESILNLLFWMRRVNKISRKHGGKPKQQKKQRQQQTPQRGNTNGYDGNSTGEIGGVAQPSGLFNPYTG